MQFESTSPGGSTAARLDKPTTAKSRLNRWFFETSREASSGAKRQVWWKVMTLTGVDYFSSLGYAPGIAFLAAQDLSPVATIILVLLTLLGALPIYRKVAHESPHGQGSIAMLERLLPSWKGKLLVLCLLGFAATDFIITITLSAADAATHLIQNPICQQLHIHDRMAVTVFMLCILGAVFMKGFREAIGLCIWIVGAYLTLNVVVVGAGVLAIIHNASEPAATGTAALGTLDAWWLLVNKQHHGSILSMLAVAGVMFPKLALGMSGFETGVAVMPNVVGFPDDDSKTPEGRIKHTRYLLVTAALIMSTFLIASSFITTLLIPAAQFQPTGAANGRALAYLAHQILPKPFGTFYDVSTILILWFAGASAFAGLLNLVPRYLPRYGMAPNWARSTRPLVLFFLAISLFVTWWFKADVDAQGGAYATGVLVLMTSAALASTLVIWRTEKFRRIYFLAITGVFIYTTIINSIERPDGLHIASVFIALILLSSFISRAVRSTELRVKKVIFDPIATQFIQDDACKVERVSIVAHKPDDIDYMQRERDARETHNLGGPFIFLEVTITDASEFSSDSVEVKGVQTADGHRILRCHSAAVPNTLAALLLYIRDETDTVPHLYTGWTEGNPIVYILRYLFLGDGETAPVTREILRQAEHSPPRRPRVHVC
jgi:hypothetical protein